MDRLSFATVWLGGCSGCHMSFLDLDEWLIELADRVDFVYSPFLDVKVYPENVDVVLVEGAIANTEHLEMIRRVRRNTRLLVSFGDCAVTGNVTALRNALGGAEALLRQVYQDGADVQGQVPSETGLLPVLLDKVLPLHAVVKVDFYLPGCPPSPDKIRAVIEQAQTGGPPQPAGGEPKFG